MNMDMNNRGNQIIAVLIIIVLAGLGFYLFKSGKSESPKEMESKFFKADKILPADTVVKITQN